MLLTTKLPVLLPDRAPLTPDEAHQELSVVKTQVCQSSAYCSQSASSCTESILYTGVHVPLVFQVSRLVPPLFAP